MAYTDPRTIKPISDRLVGLALEDVAGSGASEASAITVEAGDDGLASGSVQEALQSLASRIQALEDEAAQA